MYMVDESRIAFFFFNDTATTEIYTLSLHDALPIFLPRRIRQHHPALGDGFRAVPRRLDVAGAVPALHLGAGRHLVRAQDRAAAVRLQLDQGNAAPLSLRPADAAGLEGVPARVAGLGRP